LKLTRSVSFNPNLFDPQDYGSCFPLYTAWGSPMWTLTPKASPWYTSLGQLFPRTDEVMTVNFSFRTPPLPKKGIVVATPPLDDASAFPVLVFYLFFSCFPPDPLAGRPLPGRAWKFFAFFPTWLGECFLSTVQLRIR